MPTWNQTAKALRYKSEIELNHIDDGRVKPLRAGHLEKKRVRY